MSLRWKIVGGFGLLLVLIGLLGWVTLSLFSSIQGVQKRVFDNAIPGLVAVDEMVRSYTAQSAAIRGYLIGSQPDLLAQYREEKSIAGGWQNRAEQLFTGPTERRLLDKLEKAGRSFQRLVDRRVIPLAQAGRRSHAFLLLGQEASPRISAIERLGSRLRDQQDRSVSATEDQVRSTSNEALFILVAVLIGAVAVVILLMIFLPRRLVRNLSTLVDAVRAVGRGSLNQSLDIKSGDEVEELAVRFTEMQSSLERLQRLAVQERELEIAASIQANLIRNVPPIPGVKFNAVQRQANRVGGDWYDVDVRGTKMTVVVGDASGKGIGAALMATVALSVLRAELSLGGGPERVVGRANQALAIAGEADSFATLVYADIDLSTGEATWLNMGHPLPFLVRWNEEGPAEPHGRFVSGPRNRALGWFEDPGSETTSLQLVPGELLILYTDGFVEAKDPDGEVFGEERLAEAILQLVPLGPEALGEELIAMVESFAAGKLDDDLTLLVIQYEGQAQEQEPITARVSPGSEAQPRP